MSRLSLSVLPLSVPSLARGVRVLAARVGGSRLAAVVMSRCRRSVPALASAALVSARALAPQFFAFGRPLSLGRVAGVASVRSFHAAGRRGRRIASADFYPAGVACGGGALSRAVSQGGRSAGAVTFASSCAFGRQRPNPAFERDACRQAGSRPSTLR